MEPMPLQEHLKNLETSLHKKNIRTDPQKLDELLADEFFEFGVSGTVWTKQGVIDALKDESFSERTISDFTLHLLSDTVALVTYRAHRHETERRPPADSLRCSLWKYTGEQWKMVFHQGTPLPDSSIKNQSNAQ